MDIINSFLLFSLSPLTNGVCLFTVFLTLLDAGHKRMFTIGNGLLMKGNEIPSWSLLLKINTDHIK